MQLAPIVIFVYNRPWHTKQTIESLQKNLYADESELFIFSDGPKNALDYERVKKVRTYLNSLNNFKKINIQESETNKGLANSVIDGVSQVIGEYDRAIVLEDDLLSAPGFIKFMNEALKFYEENDQIFSISGYSFPLDIPEEYKNDVYILPRASTWGWGSWKNRWQTFDWNLADFNEFIQNKTLQADFNKGGEDLTPMLKAQVYGYIDSWGIRWSYAHYKNKSFCLYPVKSKLNNIGADKSGTHTARTKKFEVTLDNQLSSLIFPKKLCLDKDIHTSMKRFLKLSIQRKIINYFRYAHLLNRKTK